MRPLLMLITVSCALMMVSTACGKKVEPAQTPSPATPGGPSEGAAPPATEAPAATPATAEPEPEAARALSVDETVRSYLTLGAAGDLSKIRGLVVDACHETPVGDVEAVKMLGARLSVSGVAVEVLEETAERATVSAAVSGSVDATDTRVETDIFGKTVTLEASSMKMDGVTKTSRLELIKQGGRWLIACP